MITRSLVQIPMWLCEVRADPTPIERVLAEPSE